MTHPPPDPEGRRQQDEWLDLPALAAQLAWDHPEIERRILLVLGEIRWEAAARLDAALAVKDAGEAVERCWALVRELRGE